MDVNTLVDIQMSITGGQTAGNTGNADGTLSSVAKVIVPQEQPKVDETPTGEIAREILKFVQEK